MKKRTSKPNIENISINIDERLTNTVNSEKEFGEFIRITTPYFYENKHLVIPINLPIKQHKHSLKYKTWNRKTIKLKKINDNFYVFITYEKPNKELKTIGKSIGLDSGYKKLLVTSENQFIGQEFESIYNKISRKKQKSKAFNKALIERNNLINQVVNKQLDISNVKELIIENLKSVKHKSKFSKKFNNKLQRWTYPKVINKLERICEENGVLFTKINPAYTSQTCSKCGAIDKTNRRGESYQCKACGINIDADYNAAINILHRGIYSPSTKQTEYFS